MFLFTDCNFVNILNSDILLILGKFVNVATSVASKYEILWNNKFLFSDFHL